MMHLAVFEVALLAAVILALLMPGELFIRPPAAGKPDKRGKL